MGLAVDAGTASKCSSQLLWDGAHYTATCNFTRNWGMICPGTRNPSLLLIRLGHFTFMNSRIKLVSLAQTSDKRRAALSPMWTSLEYGAFWDPSYKATLLVQVPKTGPQFRELSV